MLLGAIGTQFGLIGYILAVILVMIILYFSRGLLGYLFKRSPQVKKIDKMWDVGFLPCNDLICNSKHSCGVAERALCRDVISKVVKPGVGVFYGQLEITLGPLDDKNSRRVDFGIKTLKGKRVAVEFDGYAAHVEEMTPIKFKDQLLRQNLLVAAGWSVLRFSSIQLQQELEKCCDILKSVINNDVAHTDADDVYKTTVVDGFPAPVAYCINPVCGSDKGLRSFHNSTTGAPFWKCTACQKTYDHDKITPMSPSQRFYQRLEISAVSPRLK